MPQSDKLQLAYQATFPNGSFQPSVDHLGIGPMLMGHSPIAVNPTIEPLPGELLISVTRPNNQPNSVTATAGMFATPVNFGPGSVSRVSATFRAPVGPMVTGGWAVLVEASTGDENDLSNATRVAATLRVPPGGKIRLNVPFGAPPSTYKDLREEFRDAIFSSVSPKPFTLDLTIDRVAGTGKAEITVENQLCSLDFDLQYLGSNDGRIITAMAAGVGMGASPGQTVSAHLRDFRIFVPRKA